MEPAEILRIALSLKMMALAPFVILLAVVCSYGALVLYRAARADWCVRRESPEDWRTTNYVDIGVEGVGALILLGSAVVIAGLLAAAVIEDKRGYKDFTIACADAAPVIAKDPKIQHVRSYLKICPAEKLAVALEKAPRTANRTMLLDMLRNVMS